ncbi:hypothetical protein, partial [Klebsiella pneumoniae]|uniref:hypothetical protein n=1 Tax=Klebsiella pneumoniae TaxID=573 RepID=UPI001BA87D1B
ACTSDSVMLVRGMKPMEKRLGRSLVVSLFVSFWHLLGNFRPASKLVLLAAAERPSGASQ